MIKNKLFMKKILFLFFLFLNIKSYSQDKKFDKIDKFVDYWLGKPYKFGGATERGIDCSALVQKFYKFVYEIDVPRTAFKQFEFLKKTSLKKILVGDILYFESKTSPSKWHCGIYIGDDKFIHAANLKEGVKISCVHEKKYYNNLKGVRNL